MEQIKISFIVPTFNPSEDDGFFSKCIKSILKVYQEGDEILVVDDGSNNRSYIENVCSKFKNITIVHLKHNTGISNARNVGIEKSRNKFIVIVDSDDYISDSKAFTRTRTNVTKDSQYDLYIFGTYSNRKGEIKKSISAQKPINIDDLKIQTIFKYAAEYTPELEPVGTTWSKIFKKDFIEKNNLKFDTSLHRSEDYLFFYDFLCKNPRIKIIEEYAYFYRINPKSTIHSYDSNVYDKFANSIKAFEHKINFRDEKTREAFLYKKTDYIIGAIIHTFHKNNHASIFDKIKKVKYILNDSNNLTTIRSIELYRYPLQIKPFVIRLLRYKMVLTVSILLEARRRLIIVKGDIKNWHVTTISHPKSSIRSIKTIHQLSIRSTSAFRSLF